MAIDSPEKRRSMMSFSLPLWDSLPVADGSFDDGDRAHLLGFYSGVPFAAVAPMVPVNTLMRDIMQGIMRPIMFQLDDHGDD